MKKCESLADTRILPFDVRYALKYRQGQMGKQEIEALAVNGFEEASRYLVLKALGKQKDKTSYMDALYAMIRGEPLDNIEHLVGDTTVDGHKISITTGLSVFGDWETGYEAASERLKHSGQTPILIAHSTMLGLLKFTDEHARVGIIVPEWYGDDEVVGFQVSNSGIHGLTADSLRFDNPCLVDDTIDTGTNLGAATKFWTNNTGANPETAIIFDARMHPLVSKAVD